MEIDLFTGLAFDVNKEYSSIREGLLYNEKVTTEVMERILHDLDEYTDIYSGEEDYCIKQYDSLIRLEIKKDDVLVVSRNYNFNDNLN